MDIFSDLIKSVQFELQNYSNFPNKNVKKLLLEISKLNKILEIKSQNIEFDLVGSNLIKNESSMIGKNIDDWNMLYSIVKNMGNGDIEAGKVKAIHTLQKDIFDYASMQSKQVKLLLFFSYPEKYHFFQDHLKMSKSEMFVLDIELKILKSPNAIHTTIYKEINSEEIIIATDILNRLGFGNNELLDKISDLKNKKVNRNPLALEMSRD